MKIRRWELTAVEDGQREVSYHRTESAAFCALADRWIPVMERNGVSVEESGVTDGVITDEDEFRESLSCYLYVDYWIEEDVIDTDEWEEVK